MGTSFGSWLMVRMPDSDDRRPTNYGAVQSEAMSIPVERCIVSRDITEPRLAPDGCSIVYATAAGGSAALMIDRLDGTPVRQLSSYPPPGTGRGLGGGCWCWNGESTAVVYAARDGNLWVQPVPTGAVRPLTSHGPERVASAPAMTTVGRQVVYVLDEAEIWMIDADTGASMRLDDGSADFVFDPCWSDDGASVLWQAWNVPDMPWDHARVQRVELQTMARSEWRADGAVQQPRLLSDGTSICVRDDTAWLNVWVGDAPLVDEPFEHAGPTWGMGQRSYAVSPDGGRVAFTRNEGGFGRLCVADLANRTVDQVARGVHGQLSWQGDRLAGLRTGARTPTQIVVYDDATWERKVVAIGPLSGWEDLPLSEPELVEIAASDGSVIHARLYRADTTTDRLLCWLHGGPTDQWQVSFMPRIAFWRSQGWNILVPDHRGSTGHGRVYQQALRGQWGVLDVIDTADAIGHAYAMGWGTPSTTALVGSSAGGFTALGVAAAHTKLVAAVIAAYPVTDLADLAQRSHRFERHYTDSLVGVLPEAAHDYHDRSPLHFADELALTPLLLMHGDSDPVVPVEQSIALAARCREAGANVELVVYEGEGHGFRQPDNQLDEYRRMQAFLSRHLLGG